MVVFYRNDFFHLLSKFEHADFAINGVAVTSKTNMGKMVSEKVVSVEVGHGVIVEEQIPDLFFLVGPFESSGEMNDSSVVVISSNGINVKSSSLVINKLVRIYMASVKILQKSGC